jgi:hypothetical protein
MWRLPLVWFLSLALTLLVSGPTVFAVPSLGAGSGMTVNVGHVRAHHVHEVSGHSTHAMAVTGAASHDPISDCCNSNGFHCGSMQAVSTTTTVLPFFPLAQNTVPALRVSDYVGPTLARLIRPPIV